MSMTLIKFQPKLISLISNPRIIVGEKPNTTRDGSTFSLIGNRTGDFVLEAIEDRENIILTNVVNVLYNGKFDRNKYVDEGILDLIELFEKHNPSKIICLGAIARDYVSSIKVECSVWDMPHPSYINKFLSSYRQDYLKMLRNELDR